jgi:hypothetical protein
VVAAAERRSAWARSHGEARRALVDPVLPLLAGRPLLPVPVPTGAAHGPCDRRWRWRGRLGERTGTPPADLWARSWREAAGATGTCGSAPSPSPGFDGDWARLSDEIMRRSPRALVRSGLGGQAQPSGGPARTACRRRSGCRQLAGEATHDLVEALLWSLAAELPGSGLATPPRSPWPWWPTCRPHRRAPGLRPVDAHHHAGRTALAAGRRDLALEVFAAANRPRPSAGLPGRAIPGAHRPATTPPSPPRSPVGRPGRRCRATPAIPAQPVVS